MKYPQLTTIIASSLMILPVIGEQSEPSPAATKKGNVEFPRITVTGLGPENGVMRRDPCAVIKVGDLYYVYYSKGPKFSGYDATLWYATSEDGVAWEEKGMALPKGGEGQWDEDSVFTPNILAAEGKYYLFYTGTSKTPPHKPDSQIGVAISDSPDGPWVRGDANPVIKRSEVKSDFDSHLIDDSCLIVRDGKYWMYYKGRELGKKSSQTQMGLAVAEKPEGPYTKHESGPVIPENHEVVVWTEGSGVAAMIGHVGPKNIVHTIMYAEDGLNFKVIEKMAKKSPWAAGTYRPDAFTDSKEAVKPSWGIEMHRDSAKQLPYLRRFEIKRGK